MVLVLPQTTQEKPVLQQQVPNQQNNAALIAALLRPQQIQNVEGGIGQIAKAFAAKRLNQRQEQAATDRNVALAEAIISGDPNAAARINPRVGLRILEGQKEEEQRREAQRRADAAPPSNFVNMINPITGEVRSVGQGTSDQLELSQQGFVKSGEFKPREDKAPSNFVNMVNPSTGEVRAVGKGTQEQLSLTQQGFVVGGTVSTGKGTEFEVGPDGTVRFTQGGARTPTGNQPLSKGTSSETQKRIIGDREILASLQDISSGFKPEFQQIGTRLSNAFASAQARVGLKLSKGQRKGLTEFSQFKARSINIINNRLNQLSGAAVSPQEAIRIRQGLPDVGDGLFGGDDPVTFKAKMDAAMQDIRLSVARRNWAVRNGISEKPWEVAGLDQMVDIINRRETELRQELTAQNPNADEQAIDSQVIQTMSDEFGLPVPGRPPAPQSQAPVQSPFPQVQQATPVPQATEPQLQPQAQPSTGSVTLQLPAEGGSQAINVPSGAVELLRTDPEGFSEAFDQKYGAGAAAAALGG